jgi:hypothetical protein
MRAARFGVWLLPTLLVAAVFLGGCQSAPGEAPREPEVVSFRRNVEEKYPRVYLNLFAPDVTGEAFLAELRASGMFEDVTLRDAFAPVSLHVNLSRRKISGEGEFGKEMLSAATVFVVPVNYTFATRLEVTVGVRGERIWEGSFEQAVKSTAFLLSDPFADDRKVAKALVAQMFRRMQEERVFEERVPAAVAQQTNR